MTQFYLAIATVLLALSPVEAASQKELSTIAESGNPKNISSSNRGWASRLLDQMDRYVLTGGADHGRAEAAVQEARQFLSSLNLTLTCSARVLALLQRVSDGIMELTLTSDPGSDWAFKMLDANARPSSGNLAGRTFWLGSFDQCVDISVEENNSSVGRLSFGGKYCVSRVTIQRNLTSSIPIQLDQFNSTLKIASCWPSSCTANDFQILFKEFHRPLFDDSAVEVPEHLCQLKSDSLVDATSVILLMILIIPMVMVVLSTSYDYLDLYKRRKDKAKSKTKSVSDVRRYALDTCSKRKWLLLLFSGRQSARKLFSASPEAADVSCINGLRFLNVVWLIAAQVGAFAHRDYPWDNHGQVFNVKDNLIIPLVTGATYVTDSYLFISGFCLVYVVLELVVNWKEEKTRNILLLAPARFMRLTPSYAFVVIAMSGPMTWLGRGPLWTRVIEESHHCRTSWWTNLLYVNNLALSYEKQCIKSSWYLSLDLQCYLLALPLLIFLTKKPDVAKNVILILTLMSSLTVGVLIGQFQMEQFFGGRFTFENFSEYFSYMLSVPWTRIGVFFMGMVVAHKTHEVRVDGFKMKPSTYLSGWAVSAAVFAALIYGPLPYSTGHTRMHRATEVLYGVLCRPLFGAVIGWTVFACATGNGGFVNRILSAPRWRRLDRLTFCIYLVHEPVLNIIFWTVKSNVYLTMEYLVITYLGSLLITIKTAILLFVVIEAPLSGLRRAMFARFVRPPLSGASVETDQQLKTYSTFAAPPTACAHELMSDDHAFRIATSTDEEEEFSVTDVRSDHERKERKNFIVGP